MSVSLTLVRDARRVQNAGSTAYAGQRQHGCPTAPIAPGTRCRASGPLASKTPHCCKNRKRIPAYPYPWLRTSGPFRNEPASGSEPRTETMATAQQARGACVLVYCANNHGMNTIRAYTVYSSAAIAGSHKEMRRHIGAAHANGITGERQKQTSTDSHVSKTDFLMSWNDANHVPHTLTPSRRGWWVPTFLRAAGCSQLAGACWVARSSSNRSADKIDCKRRWIRVVAVHVVGGNLIRFGNTY